MRLATRDTHIIASRFGSLAVCLHSHPDIVLKGVLAEEGTTTTPVAYKHPVSTCVAPMSIVTTCAPAVMLVCLYVVFL